MVIVAQDDSVRHCFGARRPIRSDGGATHHHAAIEAIEDAAGGYAELDHNEQEEVEKLYKPFVRLAQAV